MVAKSPREMVSDAARRCADIINQEISLRNWDDIKNMWIAIRLSDGGYDGTLYESKRDAVRHQEDEFLCAYICFRNIAAGITPFEAEKFLDFNRRAYRAGFRLPDPDHKTGGPDLFLSTDDHDRLRNLHVRNFLHRYPLPKLRSN